MANRYIYSPFNPNWFSFYTKLDDMFDDFVLAIKKAPAEVKIQERLTPTKKQELEQPYPYQAQLDKVIKNFEQFADTIDTGGAFKKSRLKLSDDKRNTFSFALASKGLFRVPEYFSEELKNDQPDLFITNNSDELVVPGVVPDNMVQSIELAQNQRKYIFKTEDKIYELRQQQKGTAFIMAHNPKARLTMENSSMWYSQPGFFHNKNLVFASSFRKSYIEFPKLGGVGRSVDLYIPFAIIEGLSMTEQITSIIPMNLAYQFFTEARIRVRLNIIRIIGTVMPNADSVNVVTAFTVKDFNDPLDWNKIVSMLGIEKNKETLTQTAVGKMMIERGEYTTIEKYNAFGELITTKKLENRDRAYAYKLLYNDDSIANTEFARYKNWLVEQVDIGKISIPVVPKPLMLMISTSGLLKKDFNDINKDQELAKIVREKFYKLIDVVDLYFNQKTSEVINRIAKRMLPSSSTTEIKNYLVTVAGMLYKDQFIRSGAYQNSPEEIEEANREYLSTVGKINDVMQNYQ